MVLAALFTVCLKVKQNARTPYRLKAATLEPVTLDSFSDITRNGSTTDSQVCARLTGQCTLKRPVLARHRLGRLADGSVGTLQEVLENATEQVAYDWAAQWYPMAFIQDLDPKKPHAGACS